MKNELNQQITDYCKYYRELLERILKIGVDDRETNYLFQKLACACTIDALSKCASNPNEEGQKRFTSFVKNFCNWNEHTKISLTHLVRLLELTPSSEFKKLRAFAKEEFDKWNMGELIYINRDPDYNVVISKLGSEKLQIKRGKKIILLDSITHISLLWKCRNCIVHEGRSSGGGFDILVRGDTPGYHHCDNVNSLSEYPNESWELVYPVKFFRKITLSGIDNLQKYCEKNRLNPYDYYKFGTYWIEELNSERLPD